MNIFFRTYTSIIKYVVCCLFVLTACTVPHPGPICIKDQKQYGLVDGAFRSRWWNYYKRGCSYLEGECLKYALSDFKAAINQNSKDQRMSRTYGMHIIDYFPHRELGLIYYLLNDLEAAKKELNLSISQESSSKALYYLDQVRKKQMQNKAIQVNTPVLSFFENSTDKERWTREKSILIEGYAADDQYISHIEINGSPYDLKKSAKKISFKEKIVLPQGIHKIPVKAMNLLGGTVIKIFEVNVDRKGPIIEIIDFEKTHNNIIQIKGIVSDISGKVKLYVDDKLIDLPKGKKNTFQAGKKLNPDLKESLVLKAIDRAGNETKAVINISEISRTFENKLVASRDVIDDSQYKTDRKKFINFITPEWKKTNTVYTEKVYIEGYLSSCSSLKSFVINNNIIPINNSKYVFFNIPLNLKEGKNEFQVLIENEKKQQLSKIISFNRIIPEISKLETRLHIAMNNLMASSIASDSRDVFQDMMLKTFIERKRFFIIPKFPVKEKIRPLPYDIEEKKISHISLSGQYIDSRYGIEVAVRLIDNESTRILLAKDTYSETKDKQSILNMVESLSLKIHNEFPIITGNIKQIDNDVLKISLGQKQLKAQNRLIIFRESQINKKPEILGFARITETDNFSSKVLIIHAKRPIKINDRVITQ